MAIKELFGLVVLLLAVESGCSYQLIPPSLYALIDHILENPDPIPIEYLGPHRSQVINFAKQEDNIQGLFNLWNRPGLRYLVDLMFITAAKNDSEIIEWARAKNLPIATDDTDISEYIKEHCLPTNIGKRTGPIVPRRRTVTVPYAPDGFDKDLWRDQYRKMAYGDITEEEFEAYEAREQARVDSETASRQALLDAVTEYVTSTPESTEGTTISTEQALLNSIIEYIQYKTEKRQEKTRPSNAFKKVLDALIDHLTITSTVEEKESIFESKRRLLEGITKYYATSRPEATEETVTTTKEELLDAVTEYVTNTRETSTTAATKQTLMKAIFEYVKSQIETKEKSSNSGGKQALDAITEYVTARAQMEETSTPASDGKRALDAITDFVTSRTSTVATQELLDAVTELVTSNAETTEETVTMDTSDNDKGYISTVEDIFQTSESSDLEPTEAEVTTIAQELKTLLEEQEDAEKSRQMAKRAKDDSPNDSSRQNEFPSSRDIPSTSFTCADKPHVPGFYADMDTGCQVFHVCHNLRTESFLCPVGTLFNQERQVCDHWYSVDCTQSPAHYQSNIRPTSTPKSCMEWTKVHQFLPVSCRVQPSQESTGPVNDVEDKESRANDVLKGLEKMSALLSEDVSADTVRKMTDNYSKLAKDIE